MSSTADTGGDGVPTLEDRDVDALTQVMTVLDDVEPYSADLPPIRGADDMFLVVHEDEYVVDLRTGTCTCEDWFYREPEGGCKHLRRVEFAVEERDPPEWVDPSAIDDRLGYHVR